MIGVIKKLMDKGYGFIHSDEMDKDIFFHSNSLVGVSFTDLKEGEKVSFEVEETDKGKNAVNVQRA